MEGRNLPYKSRTGTVESAIHVMNTFDSPALTQHTFEGMGEKEMGGYITDVSRPLISVHIAATESLAFSTIKECTVKTAGRKVHLWVAAP